MARVTRFLAIVALLTIFGTPELSCFVPRQLLNAAESDCCRQMGGQCGSTTMPSSQSCCTSPAQVSQPYICGKIGTTALSLRSEEHTSELQSHLNLVCRLLLEKKKKDRSRWSTRRP